MIDCALESELPGGRGYGERVIRALSSARLALTEEGAVNLREDVGSPIQ